MSCVNCECWDCDKRVSIGHFVVDLFETPVIQRLEIKQGEGGPNLGSHTGYPRCKKGTRYPESVFRTALEAEKYLEKNYPDYFEKYLKGE